jgi:hypothetical protein
LSARGNFFAVDWRCVEDATRQGDGVNTALAYLTLARHTSRNHATTTAAATAIVNKLGLTRGRADLALKTLENTGLVSSPKRGTFRTLAPWASLQAERAKLTDRQREVVQRVLGRRHPITSSADPDYQVAYALKQRGILALADGKPGFSRFAVEAPDWIWLPNTLVDGFAEGDSPFARLRQARDPEAVRLLLDIYRHANLAEDGGIPWQALRRHFDRVEVDRYGAFTIWGFVPCGLKATWDPYFTRLRALGQDAGSKALWDTFAILEAAGLVETVAYIVEGLEEGAQALHAFAMPGTGEPEERAVRNAAHTAGRRMVRSGMIERAAEKIGSVPWLCPVRSHVAGAEAVGIVRPVHRPHTKRTAAWSANFLSGCAEYVELFGLLGQSETKSVA